MEDITMKKVMDTKQAYTSPVMEVITIGSPVIMAGSPNGVLDSGSPTEPAYGRFFDNDFE